MAANTLDGVDLDDLNYIQKFPYNGTGAAGGDPLTENLNIWYEVCREP
jgi:ammonium transporter, Amt family